MNKKRKISGRKVGEGRKEVENIEMNKEIKKTEWEREGRDRRIEK